MSDDTDDETDDESERGNVTYGDRKIPGDVIELESNTDDSEDDDDDEFVLTNDP